MTRIEKLYLESSERERSDGTWWYPEATIFAARLGRRYGYRLDTVVGIIALLSPGMQWERNQAEAELALRINGERKHWGVYSNLRPKLDRLLDGEEPLTVLSGQKVTSFYKAIQGDVQAVVIDRHAKCAALGITKARDKNSHVSPREYRILSERYRKVANKFGINPRDLQAIIWVHWRNKVSPT